MRCDLAVSVGSGTERLAVDLVKNSRVTARVGGHPVQVTVLDVEKPPVAASCSAPWNSAMDCPEWAASLYHRVTDVLVATQRTERGVQAVHQVMVDAANLTGGELAYYKSKCQLLEEQLARAIGGAGA